MAGNADKDWWDKADILLKPTIGVATAVLVGIFGFWANELLHRQQEVDVRTRLYTELMSRREEAESSLRRDMFAAVLKAFVTQPATDLDERIVNLELLMYNFHESLNLGPLFRHLERNIDADRRGADATRRARRDRLYRLAGEAAERQLAALAAVSTSFDREIDLDELVRSGTVVLTASLELGGIKRDFTLSVGSVKPATRELLTKVEINQPADGNRVDSAEFWVAYTDFPMIDNLRLSRDQRFAIVLRNFDEKLKIAQIRGVIFPGSHSALKERTYIQDILNEYLKVESSGRAAQPRPM